MEMEPDIKNMTLDEYRKIGAKNLKRMGHDKVLNRCDDDTSRDRNHESEVIQPLIPQPIHTTPPNNDYVAPTTKLILDEFGDEIVNVTMVDEEADSNPTRDIEDLERLLAKDPQSHSMEIQGSNSKGMEFEVS
nr:hypothetical protein [Tanacetum cinerariifolium]